jgi:DNA-directed RNA polymerase sigma subunit (sigma70/sigma32)
MPPLTEKEAALLRMRFDDTRRVATLQEVAGLLGMPLGTARRIERRALRKLRSSALGPVAQGFDGWDEV